MEKFHIGKFAITIRMTVVLIFMLATVLTAVLAIGLQYHFGRNLAKEATSELYTEASATIASELRNFSEHNISIINLLANNPALEDPQATATLMQTFAQVMEDDPLLYGVFIGRADGSFYQLVNLAGNPRARKLLHATGSDNWLLMEVTGTGSERRRVFQYMDAEFNTRIRRSEATDFDATQRSWYSEAIANPGIQRTEPYLFAQLGVPGRTVSMRVGTSDTVVAVDYTLATMSDWLRKQKLASRGEAFLYRADGQIVASSLPVRDGRSDLPLPVFELSKREQAYIDSLPTLNASNEMDWPPFDFAISGQPRGYSVDLLELIARMTGIQLQFVNGMTWAELTQQFRDGEIDLLHSVLLSDDNQNWGLASDSYTALPYVVVTPPGREQIRDLSELNGQKLAIPDAWSISGIVKRRFPQITVVSASSSLNALELVSSGQVQAALDSEYIFRYLQHHYFLSGLQYHSNVDLGTGPVPDHLHIIVPYDQPQLLAIINRAIAAIGPEQRIALEERWLHYEDPKQVQNAGVVPNDVLIAMARDPELSGRLLEVMHNERPYFAYSVATGADADKLQFGVLVPQYAVVGPYLDKVKISALVTSGFLLLLLPLSWAFANPIVYPVRQLALENDKVRRREFEQVQRVRSRVTELDQLSESMVNMVSAIQVHEQAQRELMDSFIKLIAQAIDDKSPYTGGHCERVPELALMLARQASLSTAPPFREFALDTRDEWREYRIAAWLHDCGKITTPEHVVDKGSKLETIYNRIHEIRTRFEVLWRDAEIEYLRNTAAQPHREAEFAARHAAQQQSLRDDYQFIAASNVGSESLDLASQQRLQELAGITWQRHFSDRLGLSPVEELRLSGAEPELPTTEQLLNDKPEHIVERTQSTDYPPELGINMEVPQHLYNQGELYNLLVSRGTLTTEDRFKINEHMISTIKMLESLPFPEELKNVPRYASTHHETMSGTGYPRKLSGADLSIPERILAVADVFEALTASDRPYKKAKPVSEAIEILAGMVRRGHIDKDCFELFVSDGVYLEYARRFLEPEQIDYVDRANYVENA